MWRVVRMTRSMDTSAARPGQVRRLLVLISGLSMTVLGPVANAQAEEANPPVDGCRCRVRALPGLGGPVAEAFAFNRHHVFVGGAATPNEKQVRATYWKHDRLHVIPTGLAFDEAYDINDSGLIIGSGSDPTTGDGVGWAFSRGVVHRLRGIGGPVLARGLNEAGTIVGTVTTRDGVNRPARWHRWWSEPELLPLLAGDKTGEAVGINDRDQVVGASVTVDSNSSHPVLWNRQGRVHPLGTRPVDGLAVGRALAINNKRMVAGGLSEAQPTTPQRRHAVRWGRHRLIDIGTLPGDDFSIGFAVADNGWVVGWSDRNSKQGRVTRHAFFWPGHGPELALPVLASDWATSESNARSVDSSGTVSGYSTDDSGVDHATVWTCAQRLAFKPSRPAPTRASGAILGQPKHLLGRGDQSGLQRDTVG